MASATEQLMMRIGLIDAATRPLQGIKRELAQVKQVAGAGFAQLAGGGAAIAAGAMAIQAALGPAIEMDRALGEVASLDVSQTGLQLLGEEALRFSVEYGKSATEFVRASYDIQSAIGGLSEQELPAFTRASAVLAAATKADTGAITNYMGTMYGIFEQQAAVMGKTEWVEAVAGKTATAVQMFKTTGQGMADAFGAIGANATSAGISMDEQFAVLGMLQATGSGSEAGTQFSSFLAGVGKAQKELGLKFTDSAGNILPVLDILEKLKARYGETLTLADAGELNKAFGSEVAVKMINQLITKTGSLKTNINALANTHGMGKAERMAAAMTDQWQRVEQAWFAIRAALFSAVLPSINKVVGVFADGAGVVLRWTRIFPNLTKLVAYTVLAIAGLGIVTGTWLALAGVAKLATLAWALTFGGLKLAAMASTIWVVLCKVAMAAWVTVCILAKGVTYAFAASLWVVKAAITILGAAFTVLRAIVVTVNAVLMANPILLIVASIALFAAAVFYYWDEIKATLADIGVFDALRTAFDTLLTPWRGLIALIKMALDASNKFLGSNFDTSWMDVNVLPKWASAPENIEPPTSVVNSPLATYRQGGQSRVPAGGLGQQLIQANAAATTANQKPSRTINTGDVHMHVQNPLSPGELEKELWMTTRG